MLYLAAGQYVEGYPTRKFRVLFIATRGIISSHRYGYHWIHGLFLFSFLFSFFSHLINDLLNIMPHAKKEPKIDSKKEHLSQFAEVLFHFIMIS